MSIRTLGLVCYSRHMSEDQSETPNADSVEEFLRQQRNTHNKNQLDPEMARREAQGLAGMMDEITKLMEDYPLAYPHGGEITPRVFLEKSEFQLRISSHIEALSGIGGKFIIFSHDFKKHSGDFPERVGVDSLNRLDIGIHTDPPTREQIEQIQTPEDINILQSIYFFDKGGNYGKVISLPRTVSDNRDDISNLGTTQKYVEAEMTAGDFELAGISLSMIKNRLTPQSNSSELGV